MKANGHARARLRRFGDDERGVSEAVGYIITFGISTIILVTSLQVFNEIQGYTKDLTVDRALRELGAQVSFAVEEAIRAGATYPDTTFSMRLEIPRDIHGESYRIILEQDQVKLVAAEASAEKSPGGVDLDVRGRYHLDFMQRVGVLIHCVDENTVIPDGACVINSDEGQLTVVYRKPTGWADEGVYFAQ